MKKRQKVLLGLMALGLVGGIGSAVALTRTAAEQKNTSLGTDKAVYLKWGTTEQQTAVTTSVDGLVAKTPVYRHVVVVSETSKSLTGTLSVTFALSCEDGYALTGLSITLWEASTVTDETVPETGTSSLAIGETTSSVTKTIALNGASATKYNAYYTLKFEWDGTPVEEGKTFGGKIAVSQTFAETTAQA